MEGKNILIIGAGGYLGANIALAMAQQGALVTALCHTRRNDNPGWAGAMFRIIYGDITRSETIDEIARYDYDYVIYLVSLNHFESEGEIGDVCETNILPLWNLANRLKDRVKKFIYFSTQQVYGRIEPGIVVDECVIPAPVNNYGLTHLLCENITDSFNRKSSDTRYINVRLSNGYGAPVFKNNNCWWLVVNDLCRTAFDEQVIRLQSDGSPLRDFIHVSDICRAVGLILEKDESGNIFNISSGITYTIGEIALMVQAVYKQLYNRDIPVSLPEGKVLQTSSSSRYTVCNDRLRSLDFFPQMNMETGICDLFRYLEAKNREA